MSWAETNSPRSAGAAMKTAIAALEKSDRRVSLLLKMLKQQAIVRMQRDIERIDEQLEKLLSE